MRITLEDMEIDLDTGGFYELFSQSENQVPCERERSVARQYQGMNKNFHYQAAFGFTPKRIT